jgi:ABC-2 type transport system ATP-binding protein
VAIIETQSLTKHYSNGKIKALRDFSITVEKGAIFSLLGPNGAGKTTLIKVLVGIVRPTQGSAMLFGQYIQDHSIHSRIGYLSENHRFPPFLTAKQILYHYGKMAGVKPSDLHRRIPELMKLVHLEKWSNTKVGKFSKGMMQRIGLAHALINNPDLVFLDEPTDGIDPIGRREIRDILKKLRDQGKTIFLNSHLLSEVERISDEIAILRHGQLLQRGTVQEFTAIKQQFEIRVDKPQEFKQLCADLDIPCHLTGHQLTLVLPDYEALNSVVDKARANGFLILAIQPRKISLEDYFIQVLDENRGEIA